MVKQRIDHRKGYRKGVVCFVIIVNVTVFILNFFNPGNFLNIVDKKILDFMSSVVVPLSFLDIFKGFGSSNRSSENVVDQDSNSSSRPVRIQIEHGMYGGLAGGITSGVMIGWSYDVDMHGPMGVLAAIWVIVPIVTLTAFSGGVLGAFIEVALCVGDRNDRESASRRIVLCVVGGLAAGIIVGPINGVFFGQMDRHVADWSTIVISAIPGMLSITVSLWFYRANVSPSVANKRSTTDESRANAERRQFSAVSTRSNSQALLIMRIAALALLFSGMLAGLGIVTALLSGAFDLISSLFRGYVLWANALGGLIFGLFCGMVFALGIGTSLAVGRTAVDPSAAS